MIEKDGEKVEKVEKVFNNARCLNADAVSFFIVTSGTMRHLFVLTHTLC